MAGKKTESPGKGITRKPKGKAKPGKFLKSLEVAEAPKFDWRTTDADEIELRKARALQESFGVTNLDPGHRVHSTFSVKSPSGMTYTVELLDVRERRFTCTCVDFQSNGLGTCKHAEAVLLLVQRRFPKLLRAAGKDGSDRVTLEVDPASDGPVLRGDPKALPRTVAKLFQKDGKLIADEPEDVARSIETIQHAAGGVWISREVQSWAEARRRVSERLLLRREYETKVQSGEWPPQETKVPLFPYQREGMLHLAFAERALLADEMGLGKTIQAIAACALLHRLGKARRVLIVAPASLKTEWEDQIQKFTGLPYQVVYGGRKARLAAYDAPPIFTICNYEQMRADSLDVNLRLRPDVVVLDEAQRIKNWGAKTTQAIKRLESRHAFVLTGTPLENRIDELRSLVDFLDPRILGPLFRFNRDFYVLDERGRPANYKDLDKLRERVKPHMLRRRKADVETELPARTDHTRMVQMSQLQWDTYLDHKKSADRLLAIARKRALRKMEMEILQRELAQMRMICDTNYILDEKEKTCPKLAEVADIIEEAGENDAKVIIFSEWVRMLELVRELCLRMKVGFAWHTGKVPQQRRRAEINAFKNDPGCRVFLSSDSGATGLNLQNASVVVNCDLPWNPAKLEQRIARAWRKNQQRGVTVYNLVSEGTIEHAMIGTLAFKQGLSDGVLDNLGDIKAVKLVSGQQAFMARLEQLTSIKPPASTGPAEKPPLPADRPLAFGQRLRELLGDSLVRCEERYPKEGDHSVLLVVARDAGARRNQIAALHAELFADRPSDDVRVEVIDRATAEALERLEKLGLVTPTFRASRPLDSIAAGEPAPPPLSDEDRARAKAARELATRKLRLATVLSEGGFNEEARPPLLEAIHVLGCALAIENRATEPEDLAGALKPPVANLWGDALPMLGDFVASIETTPADVIKGLGKLVS